MILAEGKIHPTSEQTHLLDGLEEKINYTLAHSRLSPEVVVNAIDRFGKLIRAGDLDGFIEQSGIGPNVKKMKDSVKLLCREYLEHKLRTELGEDFFVWHDSQPVLGLSGVRTIPVPLGTLFHIAAGNMDALPASTVAEGLLTGNVNILKLPEADNGLTIAILAKLIEIEPILAEFIYVFDTPSSDIAAMRKMAAMADGIVVWGGDAAVSSVRTLAPAGIKLIEWGNRLSFAYISGDWSNKTEEMSALACHIVTTEQLLCRSCQMIYLDTDSMENIENFCRVFLPMLQSARNSNPITDIGALEEITLKEYNAELEAVISGNSGQREALYGGRLCCLTACEDSTLELSDMFGRVPVKRLPREKIMRVLREQKGHLQTAGLICSEEDRPALTDLLIRSGINRVTRAGDMSSAFAGESHDGEYSLRRYVRMANVQL